MNEKINHNKQKRKYDNLEPAFLDENIEIIKKQINLEKEFEQMNIEQETILDQTEEIQIKKKMKCQNNLFNEQYELDTIQTYPYLCGQQNIDQNRKRLGIQHSQEQQQYNQNTMNNKHLEQQNFEKMKVLNQQQKKIIYSNQNGKQPNLLPNINAEQQQQQQYKYNNINPELNTNKSKKQYLDTAYHDQLEDSTDEEDEVQNNENMKYILGNIDDDSEDENDYHEEGHIECEKQKSKEIKDYKKQPENQLVPYTYDQFLIETFKKFMQNIYQYEQQTKDDNINFIEEYNEFIINRKNNFQENEYDFSENCDFSSQNEIELEIDCQQFENYGNGNPNTYCQQYFSQQQPCFQYQEQQNFWNFNEWEQQQTQY